MRPIISMSHTRNRNKSISRVLEKALSDQLNTSIRQLKLNLDVRIITGGRIKDLLLEVGSIIEKLNVCRLFQISTKIKELLREEIRAKKITVRYVHKVLPLKYKRPYRLQRELGSLDQGYYDIWTATSSRKKISVEGNALKCQICLPLRWLKYQLKTCHLVFPSKSVWFKIDVDLDSKRLFYFGLGDGARSPPLYCIPLHQDGAPL